MTQTMLGWRHTMHAANVAGATMHLEHQATTTTTMIVTTGRFGTVSTEVAVTTLMDWSSTNIAMTQTMLGWRHTMHAANVAGATMHHQSMSVTTGRFGVAIMDDAVIMPMDSSQMESTSMIIATIQTMPAWRP